MQLLLKVLLINLVVLEIQALTIKLGAKACYTAIHSYSKDVTIVYLLVIGKLDSVRR